MALYVNGEQIEETVIEAEIGRLRPSYEQVFEDQPRDQQEKQLSEWARENVIETVLFAQEARKAYPEIGDEDIQAALTGLLGNENEMGPIHQQLQAGAEQVQKLREDIASQLRAEKLSRQITDTITPPSEKLIQRYYETHLDRYTIPEMVHAAHIVKHPNDKITVNELHSHMQVILDKLNSGTSFEELAREHSDCPDNGGDMGFFARGQMVQSFEEVVFQLEPGACSGIFETEFGLHIAKVHEKRPAMPCPLQQVRAAIARDLTQQAKEKAIEQFLDAQKEKAVIQQR